MGRVGKEKTSTPWIVGWIGSAGWRTNIYTLIGLTLSGLLTDTDQ